MNDVTVEKAELLVIIGKNRDEHRAIFEEAVEGYRKVILAELEQRVEDVKDGKAISHMIHLQAPVDHTDDYSRVIRMLEMHIEDTVAMPESDFSAYVMDDWQWMRDFLSNASSYGSVMAARKTPRPV